MGSDDDVARYCIWGVDNIVYGPVDLATLVHWVQEQRERFIAFMELQQVRSRTEIVKQESPGDAMYLLLEGEVRVRMMIGGKERVLVTLAPGEFFGEVSLFDHGPRSADVVANKESLLLRISAGGFQ